MVEIYPSNTNKYYIYYVVYKRNCWIMLTVAEFITNQFSYHVVEKQWSVQTSHK